MWLDSVIGYLSPEKGLKRQRARKAMDMVHRAYDGAKTGRRTEGWITASTSANAEIGPANKRLRDNARDLVRNNPYAARATEVYVTNAIGTGIQPNSKAKEALAKKIMETWNTWVNQCDADGQHNFYAMQALVARGRFESGECFIRFIDRKANEGLIVPFQLQLLEADFLNTDKTGATLGGGQIIQGIELDKDGKRVAYHMWDRHPGETIGKKPESIRIPADQILHIFLKDRPGQLRGVTAYAPVMLKLNDLAEYEEAELLRKKIESCFAAFVTQSGGPDGASLGFGSKEGGSARQETFRPGMIGYLNPGEDVKFGNPSTATNGDAFVRAMLRSIASGLGITYEQITGDLSNVNYSSFRSGLLEFRRMIEARRWNVYIPMLCELVWQRFLDRAILAGVFSISQPSDRIAAWSAPKFEQIDPYKDALADLLMIRCGTLTWPEAVSRLGEDPEQQMKSIADWNKKMDELGIVLDCDPRKTTKNGITQALNMEKDDATGTDAEPAATTA